MYLISNQPPVMGMMTAAVLSATLMMEEWDGRTDAGGAGAVLTTLSRRLFFAMILPNLHKHRVTAGRPLKMT